MSGHPADPILEIDSLSVNFGGLKALSDVTLSLREGEVLGLIGPNGAGKTTLFNALSGFVTAANGSLTLFGESRKWPRPDQLVDLGIARTLQGVGLFPDLTVLENVMLGADRMAKTGLVRAALGLTYKDEKALAAKAQTVLERVYAGHLSDRRADTLSYPDTKRVAIARALLKGARILVLDEPASSLEPDLSGAFVETINALRGRLSVIYIGHCLPERLRCDVVIDLANSAGRLR